MFINEIIYCNSKDCEYRVYNCIMFIYLRVFTVFTSIFNYPQLIHLVL